MEGISGALARIDELQGRLSTLAQPAVPGRFDALLQQQTAAAPAPAPATSTEPTGPSAAWLTVQRPSFLGTAGLDAPGAAAVSRTETTAPVGAPGRTYPNGQIPASALTSIGGRDSLVGPAAQGFLDMRAAAARDGVELPVNDSYRSLAEQEEMARRKGLYSQGGLAARPGTSTHGLGLSVDLQLDGEALAWMRDNGKRFGFVEDVPREPWHWTYEA